MDKVPHPSEQSNDNATEGAGIEQSGSARDNRGQQLKVEREKQGLTVAEVGARLHLDVKFITAIENADYESVANTAYVSGYIRSYARLLKLPEQQFVDVFNTNQGEQPALLPDYMTQKREPVKRTLGNKVWGLVFLVIVGVLALTWYTIRNYDVIESIVGK